MSIVPAPSPGFAVSDAPINPPHRGGWRKRVQRRCARIAWGVPWYRSDAATVLSIGLFFSLMLAGFAATQPEAIEASLIA